MGEVSTVDCRGRMDEVSKLGRLRFLRWQRFNSALWGLAVRTLRALRAPKKRLSAPKKRCSKVVLLKQKQGPDLNPGFLRLEKAVAGGAGDEGRCIIMGIDISAISQEQENADKEERRQRLEVGALRALREL